MNTLCHFSVKTVCFYTLFLTTALAFAQQEITFTDHRKSLASLKALPVTTIQRHLVQDSNPSKTDATIFCREIKLNLSFDNYPGDISWMILDEDGVLVAKADRYNAFAKQKIQAMKQCLTPGTYTFVILDKNGDGLCCSQNEGSYHLYTEDGDSLASGSSFGSRETTTFTIYDPQSSERKISIDKVQTTEKIEYSLFPNPVQSGNLLQVEGSGNSYGYILYDVLGRTVGKGELQQNGINVDHLQSGRYTLAIEVDNRPLLMDFVKE